MRYFCLAMLAMVAVTVGGCAGVQSPQQMASVQGPDTIIRPAAYGDSRQESIQQNRAIRNSSPSMGQHVRDNMNMSCTACHDAWGRPLGGQQNASAGFGGAGTPGDGTRTH